MLQHALHACLQPVPQAMEGHAAANTTPPQASIMAQCAKIENHTKTKDSCPETLIFMMFTFFEPLGTVIREFEYTELL